MSLNKFSFRKEKEITINSCLYKLLLLYKTKLRNSGLKSNCKILIR